MNQKHKHTNNKKFGRLYSGLKIIVAVAFLGLASCAKEGRCLEETVDIGVIALDETPVLDSLFVKDTTHFRLNDSIQVSFVKQGTSKWANRSYIFHDENCDVKYKPETKLVRYQLPEPAILTYLEFYATISFPQRVKTYRLQMSYYEVGYVFENINLNLYDSAAYLKVNELEVNGKNYNNVKMIASSRGSFLFFSEQNELIEIRLSGGNVFSKIN